MDSYCPYCYSDEYRTVNGRPALVHDLDCNTTRARLINVAHPDDLNWPL